MVEARVSCAVVLLESLCSSWRRLWLCCTWLSCRASFPAHLPCVWQCWDARCHRSLASTWSLEQTHHLEAFRHTCPRDPAEFWSRTPDMWLNSLGITKPPEDYRQARVNLKVQKMHSWRERAYLSSAHQDLETLRKRPKRKSKQCF